MAVCHLSEQGAFQPRAGQDAQFEQLFLLSVHNELHQHLSTLVPCSQPDTAITCLPFYKVFCFDFMFAFAPEFNILLMCPENQYGNALIYHQQLVFYQLMGSWLCVSSPEQQNAKF